MLALQALLLLQLQPNPALNSSGVLIGLVLIGTSKTLGSLSAPIWRLSSEVSLLGIIEPSGNTVKQYADFCLLSSLYYSLRIGELDPKNRFNKFPLSVDFSFSRRSTYERLEVTGAAQSI